MTELLRPRRVVQHVLVLLVVAVLVRLGTWQLDRLGEVRDRNEAVAARLDAPAAPVTDLLDGLGLGVDDEALDALVYRPVTATGTWRPEDEVLQRGRALQGSSGYDVLTPLDLTDGSTVLVRRGWVPFDAGLRPPVTVADPPTGTVQVTGTLERSVPQPTGPIAQRDPATGRLELVFHADLARLAPQMGPLAPMTVRLAAQDPAQPGELPIPSPVATQDEGTHLSYALQWFAFAITALAFYAVLLRRQLRGEQHRVAEERPPEPAARPGAARAGGARDDGPP